MSLKKQFKEAEDRVKQIQMEDPEGLKQTEEAVEPWMILLDSTISQKDVLNILATDQESFTRLFFEFIDVSDTVDRIRRDLVDLANRCK